MNHTRQPLFTSDQLEQFATGSLAKCFGSAFSIYENRQVPRTPNGALKLVDQVLSVQGTPGDTSSPSEVISVYTVPQDAWYISENSSETIPYSILMEIGLQPCGFLATYMECPLVYRGIDLFFRNLDAKATLLQDLDLRGERITAKATMTSMAASNETIIVRFDFSLTAKGVTFFKGDTAFGYFSGPALANQLGLDRGEKQLPWFKENKIPLIKAKPINLAQKEAQNTFFVGDHSKPQYRLAGGRLNFVDHVLSFKGLGTAGKGYVYAQKTNEHSSWYYPCHFLGDPVMPGSLGLEAILEALKVHAIDQGLGAEFNNPYFTSLLNTVTWKYRGQITQKDKMMALEANIIEIKQSNGEITMIADASLWKDGLRIYEVKNIGLVIKEGAL